MESSHKRGCNPKLSYCPKSMGTRPVISFMFQLNEQGSCFIARTSRLGPIERSTRSFAQLFIKQKLWPSLIYLVNLKSSARQIESRRPACPVNSAGNLIEKVLVANAQLLSMYHSQLDTTSPFTARFGRNHPMKNGTLLLKVLQYQSSSCLSVCGQLKFAA